MSGTPRRMSGQQMRLKVWSALLLACAFGSGCTSFDASDDGGSKDVLLGKIFTISLPATPQDRAPEISPESFVRFLAFRRDSNTNQDVFEFKAIKVGEAKIKIPLPSTGADQRTYVLTVDVVLGGLVDTLPPPKGP
jgi:hypothetical protein